MEIDFIIGWIILAIVVVFITYLVLLCRSTIKLIDEKKLRSLREIMQELHNGR